MAFAKELETLLLRLVKIISKPNFPKHYLFPVQLMDKLKFTTDCIHDEWTRLVFVLNGIVDSVV